jgi:predicted kinase
VAQRGAVRLRADVERKRLFGLRPAERSGGIEGGIYTAQASQQTHERLAQLAALVLKAGYTVLVDATFLNIDTRRRFRALAQALQVPCRILAFEAPLAVLRQRVLARQAQGADASEADVAVLESQWSHLQPLSPEDLALTVHIDTTGPVDWGRLLPIGPVPDAG